MEKIKDLEKKLLEFVHRNKKAMMNAIASKKVIDEKLETELKKTLETFVKDNENA